MITELRPSSLPALPVGAIIGTVVVITITWLYGTSKQYRRPPGPKGLPFVGNLYDLPKPGEIEAHHWAKHEAIYGK